MKIVIEGCAHGELEKIYEAIELLESRDKIKVDLLICCGDFQATRNEDDLESMAVPKKYRQMCTFYKYYNGEKIAPVLTLFIGGNHEASNHLQELPFGGWAAPNIYYLGYAGVVNFGGLRIAGLSGIYKPYDYSRGHFERPPYNENTKRSVYHIRNVEVFRLKQMKSPIDICLSHDWPRGIYNYGNAQSLVQNKPFFKKEISENTLGSEPCEELLFHLKPRYWFAAHLHCKFSALVPHKTENGEVFTKFLALDKCLPRRKFMQVIEIPFDKEEPLELLYDLEWLTILHYTNHLTSVKHHMNPLPVAGCDERWDFTPTDEEKEFIFSKLGGDLVIPENFSECPKDCGQTTPTKRTSKNHQTRIFCEKLGIDDPMTLFDSSTPSTPSTGSAFEPNDISYSDDTSFIDDSGNENSFISNEADKEDSNLSPISQGRLCMQLPPPKFTNSNDSFSEESDIKHDLNFVKEKQVEEEIKTDDGLFILDESPKRQCEENNQRTPNISIKKFKRRNKDIYGSNDD